MMLSSCNSVLKDVLTVTKILITLDKTIPVKHLTKRSADSQSTSSKGSLKGCPFGCQRQIKSISRI